MGPAKALLDAGLTEGRSRVPPDTANERFAAKIISRPGTEQVTRFAAEQALSRRGKLTVSAKPESTDWLLGGAESPWTLVETRGDSHAGLVQSAPGHAFGA